MLIERTSFCERKAGSGNIPHVRCRSDQSIRSRMGITIVWVEHIMRALTQVVQRAVCLADGRLLFDGTPEEMLRDQHVRRAYLGGAVA